MSMVGTHRGSVLVVDDERSVRDLVSLVLGRESYRVDTAADGERALARLAQGQLDLMITDLKMPEMDGLTLLKYARELYPEVDVMVLTGFGSVDSAVVAMRQGALDFVTKPFEPEELRKKVNQAFAARRSIEQRHTANMEPLVVLNRILGNVGQFADQMEAVEELIKDTFRPDMMEIRLFDSQGRTGEALYQEGNEASAIPNLGFDADRVRDLAQQQPPWLLRRLERSRVFREVEGASLLVVPLEGAGEVIGALSLMRRHGVPGYSVDDAELLRIFGLQIGLSALHARMEDRVAEVFADVDVATVPAVRALSEALGTFDRYTYEHSQRVAEYACALGRALDLSQRQLELLAMAGLLHDIGKIGVGDSTLNKNGSLTDTEFEQVRMHPVKGARILESVDALADVVPIVLYHHERVDGQGYPHGLVGEEIPLLARIIALVDSYDSMMTDRPYRDALPKEEVLRRLKAAAGTHLDSRLVEVWLTASETELFRASEGCEII